MRMSNQPRQIVLGVSGASGVVYAQRLLEVLAESDCQTHVILTAPAKQVMGEELGIKDFSTQGLIGRSADRVTFHGNQDLFCKLASGSQAADAMVICPCSAHSLAAIAAGLADSLLLRCAYVCLKERRPLVLTTREAPLTQIDLQNMLTISQAGGIICPASPGFYTHPQSMDDLVDFVVGKLLDLLQIGHDLPTRWRGQ